MSFLKLGIKAIQNIGSYAIRGAKAGSAGKSGLAALSGGRAGALKNLSGRWAAWGTTAEGLAARSAVKKTALAAAAVPFAYGALTGNSQRPQA